MANDLDVKLSNFLLDFKKQYGVDVPDANELIGSYEKSFDFYNKVFSKKGITYDEFANYFNTPIPKNRTTLPKVSPDAIQGALDAYRSAQGDKQYIETQKAMQFSKENPEVLKTPDSKSDKFKQSVQRGFKVIGSDLANSFINSAYGVANIYESAVSIQDAIVSGDKVAESNLKGSRLLLEQSRKELQSLIGSDVSQKERDAFYSKGSSKFSKILGTAAEITSFGASQASMFAGGGIAEALKIARGSKVAGSIGFALGFQNGLDAINSSESGRNLPEKYKTMYASLVATTEAITEAVPFNATLGKKISKQLINPIIDKTISNIVSKGIKEITPEIFEKEAGIVSKKLLNRVTKVGSNVTKAALVEFPSEFLSSASTDILNKYINKESGQKIFEEKSWGDIVHDAARNGALGAIFAGGLSGALSAGSHKVNNHIIQTLTENKSNDGSFDIGRQKLLDEYVQTQQELGKDTSVEQLDNVINGYIDRLNKTPKDLTPIQQQAVLELSDEKDSALQKKEALEKEKEGLDVPFQNNIQQQIDAITTNIDNLDNQIGELPSMDDSEIEKTILSDISGIEIPYTEKIKSIKSNQQNETEIGIQEAGTQGNENVQNAVQVSGEKGGENVNKQVEEKLPISEQVAIPEAAQKTEGTTSLIQQEDGKERKQKGRKENVLTATTQEDISAPQVEKASGVENISDRAKEILDNSLSEYNNSSSEDKSKMILDVKDKLSANEKGLSNIGIGLDKDMVSAGNEFLNIINKQEVKPFKKENNAIQEQITSESVLREKGQGLELRPMDEGNKKYEVSTEQSKEVKEEVSKESQLKSTKNDTRGKDENRIDVGEKTKGVKREGIGEKISKIKDDKSKEILGSEPNDIRDEVLQFFIGGGKVNTDFFNSLYGNKNIKYGNVTERKAFSEAKRRLGIWNNKKGYSLDGLAEFLYNNRINDNSQTNDYKNEIEDVVNSFSDIKQMSKHFLNRREIKDYESDYYDKYSKEIEAEYLQDAEIYFDKLSENEKNLLINETTIPDDLFYKLFNEEIDAKENLDTQDVIEKSAIKINGEKKTIKEGDNVIVSHAGNDIEGVIVKDKDGNLQVEQKYSYRGNQKTKYSLDSIKEFVEEQVKDITKEQVKEPTKSKKIADNLRKAKIHKGSVRQQMANPKASFILDQAWDAAIELVAQSIEKGGDVIIAINKGIEAFKKSKWYESATKEDREVETANLEHELKIRYADSLLDNIYDEKNLLSEDIKKEQFDRLKNIIENATTKEISYKEYETLIKRSPKTFSSLGNFVKKLDIKESKINSRLDFESTKKNLIADISNTLKDNSKNINTKNISELLKLTENAKNDNDLIKISNKYNGIKREIIFEGYKKELKDNLKQILKTAAFTDSKNIDISTDNVLKLTNSIDSIKNEKSLIYASIELDNFKKSIINRDNLNKAKKELIDNLKDLRNTFKDSVVAFDKINKIYGNVNRLPKLIESISNIRDEKSFEKAREQSLKYVQDLVAVTKQRYVEQLKKSLKNKIAKTKIDNAALKELNRLNPFKLNNEEIDTMTDMLGTIKDQLNGKKEGLIPNKDIISFVNKVQERLKEEQLDKVKKEVIEKTKVEEPEDLTVLNANISALKEDIRINADSYSAYEKKQVDKILSIDVNNISNKKDLSLLIANIVANKEYHGLYDILKQDNVHKIIKNIETLVKGVKLGSNIGTKFTSQSLQIKNFFNDPKKGAEFAVKTGVHQLNSGEALAYKARTKAIESIDAVLKKNGFKNGIQDRTVEMSYTTGVLAYLRRDSSEKGRFDNVKNLIKDSISILKKGTEGEILEANAIESVYNKYVDSAENVYEVYNKIKLNSETKDDSGRNAKGALLIYDTLLSNFDERYDTYDIVTQASQGKKLKKVENYIPIRYKSVSTTLEATSIPEANVMEMMASDINSQSNVSEVTSGTMKEENMPNRLEKGGVVLNLDVLDGALDAIQEQVYDIESLEARTTLNYLFNNKKIKESLGVKLNEMLGGDWNVMGIEGVSNYRAFQKGVVSSVKSHLGIYNTKEDNDILDEANRAIANFSRGVIYNPKQIPLQTIPLGLGVTINTMPSLGFKDYYTASIVAKSIALNKDSFVLSNSSILLRSAPELILQARAATKKLNAEFDSIIKKRIKGVSNTLNTPTEWSANKTIETPDNLIARFSWMMYYLEYKKKNGEKNLGKNWDLEPRDIYAESYAEMMVSNTQGVNSQSTAAKFWKDKNGWQYLRNALFMFSGFSMNESANIKSDIRILAFGSNEQRKSAGLRISSSLSSIALYYGMYSCLALAGDYIWDSISDFLFGDDDEENKELKEKFDKLMNLKENIKSNVLSVANLIFFEGLGSEISSYSRELTDIIFGTSLADYKASTKYDSEYMKLISRIPGAYKEPFKAGYYIYKGGQYAFAGQTSGEVLRNKGKYIQEVSKEIDNQDRVLGGAVLLAEVASIVGAMPANVRNAGRNYLKQTFPKNEAVQRRDFNTATKGAEKGEKRPNPEYVK